MARLNMHNTPCSVLDHNKLNTELKENFSFVNHTIKIDSTLVVHSTREATTQEKTDIDTYIASFVDNDKSLKKPKIYDLAKSGVKGKHFHAINYKTELSQALIPKRTVVKGEVQKVEWYSALDGSNNPTDKILTVDINYTRDASGFAISRQTDRKWVNLDETDNEEVKTTEKHYFVNPSDQINEGVKRRSLLVESIQLPVLSMMVQVLTPLGYSQESVLLKGRKFLDDYEVEFNNFVKNSSTETNPASPDFGKKNIIIKLENESATEYTEWLDLAPAMLGGTTTIRQYLLNEFDI